MIISESRKAILAIFLSQFVLLSIAAGGQVKVFLPFLVLRVGQKTALPRMSPLPHLPLSENSDIFNQC